MPEKPDEEPPTGEKPDMEDSSEEIAVSDILEGDTVMITFADEKSAEKIIVMTEPNDGEDVAPQAEGTDKEKDTV